MGDLAEIKTGESDAQDAVEEGKFPFFVRSEIIERSDKYLFDGEAILVPGEGRLGEIFHYYNGKFDFHQRVYKISNFINDVTGNFVLYAMQHSFKAHALKYTVKATVDSLRMPMLTEYQISTPNIEEQQEITQHLKNLDNIITRHQRKYNEQK